jgi:hypothetical protein
MALTRLLRPPLALALCGAALLGWSVGGMASVDRDLQAELAPAPDTRTVIDRGHHHRHPHREL